MNNTPAAQWNYYGVAAIGKTGYKPTASASGNLLTLTLDYQHQFAGDAHRGCDGSYQNPPPPSPVPTPSSCDIAMTMAGSPGYENGILCQYACGGTNFTYPITSGTCSTGTNFAAARNQEGCGSALDIVSCGPTSGPPCSNITCPGGRILRVFNHSQEMQVYLANCNNYGGCTSDNADQGPLCWTPMKYSSYYIQCSSGAFADPGTAFWNNSSDSSMVFKKCTTDPDIPGGFWNDNAQSCGY